MNLKKQLKDGVVVGMNDKERSDLNDRYDYYSEFMIDSMTDKNIFVEIEEADGSKVAFETTQPKFIDLIAFIERERNEASDCSIKEFEVSKVFITRDPIKKGNFVRISIERFYNDSQCVEGTEYIEKCYEFLNYAQYYKKNDSYSVYAVSTYAKCVCLPNNMKH